MPSAAMPTSQLTAMLNDWVISISYGPEFVGALAWWDASALSLTNGASVATWPDKSRNNQDLTATGSAQPTFSNGVQNGLPAVLFNGTTNQMTGTNTLNTAAAFQVSCVFKVTNFGATSTIFSDTVNTQAEAQVRSTEYVGIGSSGTITGGTPDTSAHVGVWQFRPGAASKIYIDGTQAATGTTGVETSFVPMVGNYAGGNAAMYGYIMEILVSNSTDPTQYLSYLMTKWGL